MHTESRQLAVRSYLAAGVALVGASAIAVSPMAPPLPDVHLPAVHVPSLHEAGVKLAALTDPFAAYGQVFDAAVANLQDIFKTAAANPTPILTKVLSNQLTGFQALLASLPTSADALSTALTNAASTDPTSSLSQLLASEPAALQTLVTALQTAFGQISTALTTTVPTLLQGAATDLASANVEGAVNNVLLAALAPVFPVVGVLGPALGVVAAPLQSVVDAVGTFGPVGAILANPLQNVVNVLTLPTTQNFVVSLDVAGLIAPLVDAPAAAGLAAQGVIDAIKTGNPASVLGAIVNAPAVIGGGVLEGGIGPDIGTLVAPLIGVDPGPLVFGGLLSPNIGFNGTALIASGTISGLQGLASLVASALNPPAIPAAAKAGVVALAKTNALSATPSTLPSLKSAFLGIKTPRALTVKPTSSADAQASSAAAGTTATPDKNAAASSDQSTSTHGRHLSSNGDGGGRHARSHDSSAGGDGGSGGGRHRAA